MLLTMQAAKAGIRARAADAARAEILALVAEVGATRDRRRLEITKRGVERHINSIFGKLELGDSDEISRRVKATLAYLAGQPSSRPP